MSRQNMAAKHQFRSRNASNKALVWDVLFAFFSLGITAALLGFTPALGEFERQRAFGLDSSDVVIENPVLPVQTDDEADQAAGIENVNKNTINTTEMSDNTAVNKTDSESDAQPGVANDSADSPSDKASNDSVDNESSNETADDVTHESADSEDTATTGKPAENATDKVADETADKTTDKDSNKDSNESKNESENKADKADASLKDTLSTEANSAASDKSDNSNDSDTPSTAVSVDSLPGLGPEAPLYTDGFATRSNDDAEQEYAVTFSPNGGGGSAVTRTTTTGNITLPSIAELGIYPS